MKTSVNSIPPASRVPRICVLLDLSLSACREKLRGILRYERLFGPFQLHLPSLESTQGSQFSFADFDGIIVDCAPLLFHDDWLKRARLPIVLLDYLSPHTPPFENYGMVRCNGQAIGEMGAKHFLERHFTHFAFLDEASCINWSIARQRGFVEYLKSEGFDCQVYADGLPTGTPIKRDMQKLDRWLKNLPKPVALMAANDMRAHQALHLCAKAGIKVPGEIAVLGVDNDETICQISDPTLSSIANDNQTGGYLATELLVGLIRGKPIVKKKRNQNPEKGIEAGQDLQITPPNVQTAFYNPLYTFLRKSTSINQNAEPYVQDAFEFIQNNSGANINVFDVVKRVNVSRRLLEKQFKKTFGKTILDIINDVRFQRICMLLLETDLSVTEIAQLIGYESEYYICTAFKKRFGKTILQYRRERKPL